MAENKKFTRLINSDGTKQAVALDMVSFDEQTKKLTLYSSVDNTIKEETTIPASEVDATLSQSGLAADAKATGDAVKDVVKVGGTASGFTGIIVGTGEEEIELVEQKDFDAEIAKLNAKVGTPLVANAASAMVDTTKIYVYTGNENGYINGNWYFYNGTNWESGGVYNAVAVQTDKTLTQENKAADGKAVGDELGSLKSDLDAFVAIDAEKIPYIYQYLNESDRIEGYYYARVPDNENGVPTKTAHGTFNVYNPIILTAGTYTILDAIYAAQSFVVSSNGCIPFSTYFSVTGSYSGDITVIEDITLYITLNKNTSQRTRIVNKNSFTGVAVPYDNGLVYGEVNPVIKIESAAVDTSYYDQAFIKNGELTCNNDHQNANTSVAKYTKVDMGSDVTKVMCSGYFKDIGNVGNSITLISTKLDSYTNVQNITRGSIHIGFSPSNASIQIMVDNELITLQSYSYNTLVANQKYEFGWGINGTTITIYLPDGTSETLTDERFANLIGKYVIFEHFRYQNTATDTPTDNFGQPVISGIYCECTNGHTLRDNFKRANGSPNVSPTGHIYSQFRNAVSGDLIFENTGSSTN